MEFNIMYQIVNSNNNIMQHHANKVDPVLMSTHYSYTKHR